MRDVFPPTPLLRNAHLSDRFGAEVLLKREDLSPVRSYKLRGAFNAMRKARGEVLFVCASAGNHAQGVAYMCRHFGVQGVIFMPVTTPQQKIQKTRMFGGDAVEIRLTGDYFDDCLKAAQAFCATEGGHFLSPFDDEDVIEGQASVAVEIEQQLGRAPDHLVIPVGGGGLSAGMLSYFGTESQYTFVEPLGGACLRAALQAGRPVALPSVNTFADGAAVARIGERTFERLKGVGLANSLTIQEDRLCLTILEMLNVEESCWNLRARCLSTLCRIWGRELRAARWCASPRAGILTLSACQRSRNAPSAILGSKSISSCACHSAPAR